MMPDLFVYLLEACICLSIFAGIYMLLLRKHTFFGWNRFYLIVVTLLSVCIPWLEIGPIAEVHIQKPPAISTRIHAMEQAWEHESQRLGIQIVSLDTEDPSHTHISLFHLLLFVYLLGLARASVLKFFRFLPLIRLIRHSHWDRQTTYIGLIHPSAATPFSFGPFLVLPPEASDWEQHKIDQIMQHEQAHIREGHSLDILWIECLSILFWFFPLMSWYHRQLRDIHEYLADRSVLKGHTLKNYGQLLLTLTTQSSSIYPVHSLRSTSLKRRILMMKKEPFRKRELLLFLPPLLITIGMWLSFTQSWTGDQRLRLIAYAQANHLRIVSIHEVETDIQILHPVPDVDELEPGIIIHPLEGKTHYPGLDYPVPIGSAVYAVESGTVIFAGDKGNEFGSHIEISHAEPYASRYAELGKILVHPGQSIAKGQKIALTGPFHPHNRPYGLHAKPHLHFEFLKDGKSVYPIEYANEGYVTIREGENR
ncbi:MAG: M23/M56 family metallopeptidase [Bacteroidota bacterium]